MSKSLLQRALANGATIAKDEPVRLAIENPGGRRIGSYVARKTEPPTEKFERLWASIDGQALMTEFCFDKWIRADGDESMPRGWKIDYFHMDSHVGVEIDGGTWGFKTSEGEKVRAGRHTTGVGFRNDCIKLNAAAQRGILMFRFTTDMVTEENLLELKGVMDDRAKERAGETPSKVYRCIDPSIRKSVKKSRKAKRADR